ncbi:uncharacterized protein [Argopecten irradians]|uniref:uncharacterized protein n=1 Tax=Argopecten irradians TaxID=31199 RepID=UPI00372247A6
MATTLLQTIEDQITCTICFEIFVEPKALPCLHTFCKKCIKKFITEGSFNRRDRNGYQCPLCRRSVSVSVKLRNNPEIWADQLENNHVVSSMIDVYKTSDLKTNETRLEESGNNYPLYCFCHKRQSCNDGVPDPRRCNGIDPVKGSYGEDISKITGANVMHNCAEPVENKGPCICESTHVQEEIKLLRERINTFENNHEDPKMNQKSKTHNMYNRVVQPCRNIQLPFQGKPSWITGMEFLPSGKLLIVDYSNEAVFVFNRDLNMLSKTNIHPAPYDVMSISRSLDHVMCSIPNAQELLKCDVFQDGSIDVGQKLKVNIACKAVDSDDHCIAVCSVSELQIFERDCEIWTNILDESFSETDFTNIALKSRDRKIFVTDQISTDTHIMCLDFNGVTIWKVRDNRIRFCHGICVIGTQILLTSMNAGKMYTLSFYGDCLKEYDGFVDDVTTNPWKLVVSNRQKIICVSQYGKMLSEEDKRTIKLFHMA